jgi:hypothetical protein
VRTRLLSFALFLVLSANAWGCRFAAEAQPPEWFQWSSALFAGDVTAVEADAQRPVDLIAVRVVETYKGPEGAATASLQVPRRMWASCNLERPLAGARVLVALNPNGDTLLVPLTSAYAARLREQRGN